MIGRVAGVVVAGVVVAGALAGLLASAHGASACGSPPICNGSDPGPKIEWAVDQTQNPTVRSSVLVAYGEGTTTCTVKVSRSLRAGTLDTWDFEGATDCSVPLPQTAQAWMTGESTVFGPLCSGVRASCRSAGSAVGDYRGVGYHVTLVAPLGQGWIASPAECSGAGTDNLDCTF